MSEHNVGLVTTLFNFWAQEFSYSLSFISKVAFDYFPFVFLVDSFKANFFPLKFKKIWIQHLGFSQIYRSWWNIKVEGKALYCIAKKNKHVKRKVKEGTRSKFGDIFKEKANLLMELKDFQDRIQMEGYSKVFLITKENYEYL